MIIGVKGIKGLVRVKSYMANPLDIAAFGPVSAQEGKMQFQFKVVEAAGDRLVLSCPQIPDRTFAETLKGTGLFLDAALLPDLPEEEFYHKDLIGLHVKDEAHNALGTVAAVFNFGAGDFIEITLLAGQVATLPFTKTSVLEVNVEGGYVVVNAEDLLIATLSSKKSEQEGQA
jgi:16S rRNA processing protein RimM